TPEPRRPRTPFDFRPVGPLMQKLLMPLRCWCTNLASQTPLALASPLVWPPRQEAGAILDAMVSDWRMRLAEHCRADIERDVPDEGRWADFLLAELDTLQAEPSSLEDAFAR